MVEHLQGCARAPTRLWVQSQIPQKPKNVAEKWKDILEILHLKYRHGYVIELIQCLPSIHEAMGSIHNIT